MINYLIRRILYSIPIILGVNFIVFSLFFFVNTPDDMAELHLGGKRVTPDQIDQWKRQHSLHLPRFYNAGYDRPSVGYSQLLRTKQMSFNFNLPQTTSYRLIINAPDKNMLVGKRGLTISWPKDIKIKSDSFSNGKEVKLPVQTEKIIWYFETEQSQTAKLNIKTNVEMPGLAHRVALEIKQDLPLLQRFTRTIFYQKSIRMLFFEFGKSDRGKDIGEEILKRIVPSLSLSVPAFILGVLLTIFFSMILAFFRGTYIDKWGVVLAVMAMSISQLYYIIGAQWLFGKVLRVVPISGFDYGLESIKFLILPVFTSVVLGLGGGVRFYRTVFLEEINKDYVRTARAKGLTESVVLFLHVLKNAMIPILTQVVVTLPLLFAGSLILEAFLAIPGLGSYLLDAIRQQDFAIVQSMVFLLSFMYIIGLLLTDVSYTLVDPRVRFE